MCYTATSAKRYGKKGIDMDVSQVNSVLGQITYKPGWTLEWDIEKGCGWNDLHQPTLQIRWHMYVPDRDNPTEMVFLTSAWIIPHWDTLDKEGLVREVWRLIQRAELHEAGEFFMYGAERPFDPHAPVLHGSRHTTPIPRRTTYEELKEYGVSTGF